MKTADSNAVNDPSHDVFSGRRPSLDPFFRPKSVAVVGATETKGAVGRDVFENLLKAKGCTVYPINPKRPEVLGVKAYAKLSDLPAAPELIVVAVPSVAVPAVIGEAADMGVTAAIVISAGFKETGPAGVALEKELMAKAKGKVRIIGPNCLGALCPLSGVNASFSGVMPRPGRVAFLSQSGALGTAVLDWSIQENVGFSAFVSVGSMLDVGWGDLIEHFGRDPETDAILIYMESVGDASAFLTAAREAALSKPIIVIKAGRTEAAAKAAASHTGALAGADDVLDAAFRRSGVIRVTSISDLFHLVDALAKQPRPQGRKLAILTNAGGPAVLASDALVESGGVLSELQPSCIETLNTFLPASWSHGNPVDVLGDASAERYARALKVVEADPATDGLLVILTPQSMTDATATAKALVEAAKGMKKPVLASWMGAGSVEEGCKILIEAGIPVFEHPDTACAVFTMMWRHADNLRALYETPDLSAGAEEGVDPAAVRTLIDAARKDGRTILTEDESKQVLAAYGLPVVQTVFAKDAEDAVVAARKMTGSVVLKLWSKTITHKSDVGGVKLNLKGDDAVREAFKAIRESVTAKVGADAFGGVTVQPMVSRAGLEVILGSHTDPQFGPVILFGSGGKLVEVYKDRSLGLPPFTTTLARRVMERTKIFTALKGVRGEAGCDMAALERLLVRFSRLAAEQSWIKEMDINPLLASSEGFIALDARVVLHPVNSNEASLPRPAIRPYPVEYIGKATMKGGEEIILRPIRPEDEPRMVRFHATLSQKTVLQRYHKDLKLDERTAHARLTRICFVDWNREMVLVAERKGELLAVGRLNRLAGAHDVAEMALLVSDPCQGKGIGTALIESLKGIARKEGLKMISAAFSRDNDAMKKMLERAGFTFSNVGSSVRADYKIA
jgi:acetyltransferase